MLGDSGTEFPVNSDVFTQWAVNPVPHTRSEWQQEVQPMEIHIAEPKRLAELKATFREGSPSCWADVWVMMVSINGWESGLSSPIILCCHLKDLTDLSRQVVGYQSQFLSRSYPGTGTSDKDSGLCLFQLCWWHTQALCSLLSSFPMPANCCSFSLIFLFILCVYIHACTHLSTWKSKDNPSAVPWAHLLFPWDRVPHWPGAH